MGSLGRENHHASSSSFPPTIEGTTSTQPESCFRDTPVAVPIQTDAQQEETSVGASWPRGIQHLALALTRTTSLLKEPRLYVLIAKNTPRPKDHQRLNEVETDDLYGNIIHSAIESVLYAYIAKEKNKALR